MNGSLRARTKKNTMFIHITAPPSLVASFAAQRALGGAASELRPLERTFDEQLMCDQEKERHHSKGYETSKLRPQCISACTRMAAACASHARTTAGISWLTFPSTAPMSAPSSIMNGAT